MKFLQFVFSFLYVRNWHTGYKELSPYRTAVFAAGLLIVLLALLMIHYLQSPLVVENNVLDQSE